MYMSWIFDEYSFQYSCSGRLFSCSGRLLHQFDMHRPDIQDSCSGRLLRQFHMHRADIQDSCSGRLLYQFDMHWPDIPQRQFYNYYLVKYMSCVCIFKVSL